MTTYTPTYEASWWNGSSFATITGDDVLSLSLSYATDGDETNPFFVGDRSEMNADITLRSVATYLSATWQDRRFRIRQQMMSGSLRTVFEGIITNRTIRLAADTVAYRAIGYADLVRRSKAVTDLRFRRRGATRTTATSIEDLTNANYAAGLINEALWKAGGRPLEQDTNSTYIAAARFWYSCDDSLFIPEYGWQASENTWDECARIARDSGGQMYQAENGVIKFRSPFTPTQGTITVTWTEDDYGDIEEARDTWLAVEQVRVPWSLRAPQPPQVAFEQPEPVIVQPGAGGAYGILDLPVFKPTLPILVWDDLPLSGGVHKNTLSGLSEEAFIVSDFSGVRTWPKAGESVFVEAREIGAQWLQLRLHHTYDKPLVFNRLVLRATPIAVVASGEVVVGSGLSQFAYDDSVYVNTETHAEQLGEMMLAFLGTPRPVRKIKGLIYDERRYLGERINLTSSDLALSAVAHVITEITPDDGELMDVNVVPVDDLPQYSDLFIIGNSYASGDVKQVIW